MDGHTVIIPDRDPGKVLMGCGKVEISAIL